MMSDRRRCQPRSLAGRLLSPSRSSHHDGQALAEYVLILALVVVALIAVLTITGPAVGNVFSNAVYNLLGGTIVPRDTLQADDFWTQVAAVASYTPENPLSVTNTPGPPPVATEPVEPPITPEVTEPPEGTEPAETPDPTEEPEPTEPPPPPDVSFDYPFYDPADDPDLWERDFTDLLGPWNAEFWNWRSPTQSDMSSMTPGSGRWRTTYDTLDRTWAGSPGGSVASDFYARFTTTKYLLNEAYTLRLRKDDGMRVWIGGKLIFDGWAWDNANWRDIPFVATAGPNEIVVEMFDSGSTAVASVFLNRMFDTGACNWELSGEAYYSAPTAWSDSPGGNYAKNSICYLRLRGSIDLTGAVAPKLQFYDRYALGSNVYARVGVSVADSNEWTEVEVRRGSGTNLGWSRQIFDLSNFKGQDFTNQVIELRFVLVTGSSTPADGWWIDDITVEEDEQKIYTVGFTDNMEGTLHWFADGTWARTNEQAHSPANAWSDSPGTTYSQNTSNVLELDGKIVLDNEQLEGDPVIEPELVFWHRYQLGSNTTIAAEVSFDDRQTWSRLTGSSLASGSTNLTWTEVVIPLDEYIGQSFHFRFRLNAASNATQSDGWYIDDFSLRNRYNGLIHLNWCDNFEGGGGSWLPMGRWAIVEGVDFNAGQNQGVVARSGSRFFSDSPGANYEARTNSILQLLPRINLASATRPELSFWHQWDMESGDRLYVEVSTDLGQTWTSVWSKSASTRPPGYGSSTQPSSYYNHIRSWTREALNLSGYNGGEVMLRFRLEANNDSNIDDGWWLDDVCVQEYAEPVYSLPFNEGFESANDRWYWGGDWARVSTVQLSGSFSAHDSPNGNTQHESNGILELRGAIDLTGAVKPTLYIWDRFELADSYDYVLVEAKGSSDGGLTWSNWEQLDRIRYASATTTSWNRRQIGTTASLENYTGQQVKLRFRMYAERDARSGDGWYIDDIAVIERSGTEPIFALPFSDDAETLNDFWVFDGTWGRVRSARTISTDGLGPGGWLGEYYRDNGSVYGEFDPGDQYRGSRNDATIYFNWGTGGPGSAAGMSGISDNFLVRWTRNINVLDDGTVYEIHARSDDRIRVKIDGILVLNAWADRSYNEDNPDIALTPPLSAGVHEVVVEYFEAGGDSRVRVDFGLTSMVYHDSPAGNYVHGNDMAMTLEGMIDLRGVSSPVLNFWHKRLRASGDTFYVEVSTDEGYTWTSVYSTSSNNSSWVMANRDLSTYAGQLINIRFRTDARSNTPVSDGWYIDDIQVFDS